MAVVVRGAAHQTVAGHDDAGEPLEVLRRADPLVRVRVRRRRPCPAWRVPGGVGQVADEQADGVGGQREVGLEDPRVRAGLAVHAAGEPHHPRALPARRVGDVRLAVRSGPEVVDQPQVRPFDRLDQLAGRLDHHRRRQRPIELPVRVRVTGAALDQQVARALGQERPQRRQPVGLIDVHPQQAGLADRVLVAPRRRPNRRGDEHLLAAVGVPAASANSGPSQSPPPACPPGRK